MQSLKHISLWVNWYTDKRFVSVVIRSNCQSDWSHKDNGWCLWCILWFFLHAKNKGIFSCATWSWSSSRLNLIFAGNFSNILVYFVFMLVCILFNRWTRTIQMPWKHFNDWKPLRKSAEKMETFTRGDLFFFLVSFLLIWSSN